MLVHFFFTHDYTFEYLFKNTVIGKKMRLLTTQSTRRDRWQASERQTRGGRLFSAVINSIDERQVRENVGGCEEKKNLSLSLSCFLASIHYYCTSI